MCRRRRECQKDRAVKNLNIAGPVLRLVEIVIQYQVSSLQSVAYPYRPERLRNIRLKMSTFAAFHNVRILALLQKLLILNRAFTIISLICIRLYKGHIVTYQEIVLQHAAALEL